MTQLCRALEEPITEMASTSFFFDAVSQAFLKPLTVSGSTYSFISARVIFPQEQTATNAPNSVSSATGFVDPNGATVTVQLKTKVSALFLSLPPRMHAAYKLIEIMPAAIITSCILICGVLISSR